MMSIGLIENLSRAQTATTALTYFFCQDSDYKLNTLQVIIQGLIFRETANGAQRAPARPLG